MIQVGYIQSDVGFLKIVGGAAGIQKVSWQDAIPEQTPKPQGIVAECIQQLEEYFQGGRDQFDLKLDWTGATEFNKSVWRELLEIPYGRTTSYSAIAEKINNPEAVRAVGLANRNNPIAVIVPCHRVIAKNGDLHGYFYGLDTKRRLLEIENPMSFARQGSLFD